MTILWCRWKWRTFNLDSTKLLLISACIVFVRNMAHFIFDLQDVSAIVRVDSNAVLNLNLDRQGPAGSSSDSLVQCLRPADPNLFWHFLFSQSFSQINDLCFTWPSHLYFFGTLEKYMHPVGISVFKSYLSVALADFIPTNTSVTVDSHFLWDAVKGCIRNQSISLSSDLNKTWNQEIQALESQLAS